MSFDNGIGTVLDSHHTNDWAAGNNAMQETRQSILEILRSAGEATVDEIVDALRERRGDSITAVTVRHHLNTLEREQLVTTPGIRHSNKPGRPQHVYTLSPKANDHLPNNYRRLSQELLVQLRNQLPPSAVNVILDGVAGNMLASVSIPADATIEQRLHLAVEFLNHQGYVASWEAQDDGFVLKTHNCPYHEIAQVDDGLCGMDMRMLSLLIGMTPRLLSRISQGDNVCAYYIPSTAQNTL
jgi:predicted ArsR family transcriptional regulator